MEAENRLVLEMTSRIGSVVILIFAGLTAAWGQVGLSPDELKLFHLLNQEREKSGLPKLQWDYLLAEAARAHAQLEAEHRELAHQFPGEPPLGDRIGATGLRFNSASENVVSGPTTEQLHQGLMGSPPHRANILSDKYNAVGLAIIPASGELYVAQNFAHVLPAYSEEQFRNGVVAAFNKLRQAKGIGATSARPDTRLHDAACSENANATELLKGLPGATDLVVFTASVPEKLPAGVQKAAGDATLRRMNIGVCFRPGSEHGYGSFWVVAAFYPVD